MATTEALQKTKDTAWDLFHNKGLSPRQIAERLNKSYWSVVVYLRQRTQIPLKQYRAGVQTRLCRMLNKLGYTDRQIGKLMGVNRATISYRLENCREFGDPSFLLRIVNAVQDKKGDHPKKHVVYRATWHNDDILCIINLETDNIYFIEYNELMGNCEIVSTT